MVCWCGIGHKITEEGYNVSFLALLYVVLGVGHIPYAYFAYMNCGIRLAVSL